MTLLRLIKSGVKAILEAVIGTERLNSLLLNRYRFNYVCDKYMARHATQRKITLNDSNYKKLVKNGFVVLNDIHPPELIKELHDNLFQKMEKIREGNADPDWDTIVYRKDGIYRLQGLEKEISRISEITQHKYIRKLVEAYINEPFRVDKVYADYKPDLVHDHTTQLHFDTWTTTIKVFTLLKDVSDANAPMAYWQGTHKDAEWRRRFDYLLWSGDYVGTAGQIPGHVIRDQSEKKGGFNNIQEKILTGKAGQVVIADVRGIHRASNLREGYRLELVQKIAP